MYDPREIGELRAQLRTAQREAQALRERLTQRNDEIAELKKQHEGTTNDDDTGNDEGGTSEASSPGT